MRSARRRRHADELGEPEMLPMMNVLFILVLVLMGLSTFIPLGAISTQAPRLAGPLGGSTATEGKQPLNLTVMLRREGISLSVSGAVEKISTGAEFDFRALNLRLERIKTQYPDQKRIMIMADPDTVYDDIIQTMDAARLSNHQKIMFPEVAFIPGVLN